MSLLFEAPENNWRVEQFKDNSSQQALICSILTQISHFRKTKESIKSSALFKNFEGRYLKGNEVGSFLASMLTFLMCCYTGKNLFLAVLPKLE